MIYLALGSRFILGTIFILAGISKVFRTASFARALRKFELLPNSLVAPISVAVPILELLCGLVLVLGVVPSLAALLLVISLIAFTTFIGRALIERKKIECGCFGPTAPRPITWWTVVRNMVLLCFGLLVIFVPADALSMYPGISLADRVVPPLVTTSAIVVALTAVALAITSILLSEVWRAHRAMLTLSVQAEDE